MSTEALEWPQIAEACPGGWALYIYYGLAEIQTRIHTKDFATGHQIVNAIGEVAEEMNHHADLDLRTSRVDVRLTSGYEIDGVTQTDLRLARRISDIAAAAGVQHECDSISRLELFLDTPDHERIGPFWAAVLNRRYLTGTSHVTGRPWADVGDPYQTQPMISFGHPASEEPHRRWHPEIWVDPTQVQPRLDAALAAGGTVVSDELAPRLWELSDPDGNRVTLITWQPPSATATG